MIIEALVKAISTDHQHNGSLEFQYCFSISIDMAALNRYKKFTLRHLGLQLGLDLNEQTHQNQ
jgi:hypothetical protein